MRRLLTGLLGIGLLSTAWAFYALGQQPALLNAKASQDTVVLMRAKLSSSQKVVEGLMAGDFQMISKGGRDLQKICDSNQWRRGEDQVVSHYRSELRRGATKLVAQAEDKNLDGAAYTYMHTLSTCINCHDYSRNVARVAVGDVNPVVPIPVTEHENSAYQARSIYR